MSRATLTELIKRKIIMHGNGIALLFNRMDSGLFQDVILKSATSMKILRKRIRFYRQDGTQGGSPGCGSVLFAFGEENDRILKENNLEGVYIKLN